MHIFIYIIYCLFLGGVGISIGLATYGYKIMAALGTKLAVITPSRGYCIELGAAFIIMIGTTQGWPLSTTHCQVGATIGVGLFEVRSSQYNNDNFAYNPGSQGLNGTA
jgi:sodium-dependent phosphate transporter